MQTLVPKLEMIEIARRGDEIFERVVQPRLRSEDGGKFVAIDIDSESYEIDADDYSAMVRLRDRLENPEIWLCRAGEKAAYRFGLRSVTGELE